MMDKELLELAAKAADIDIEWNDFHKQWVMDNEEEGWFSLIEWNPLKNTTQAFNLAVKLRLDILIRGIATIVPYKDLQPIKHGENPYEATRRAIVETAAEIGKDMK